MPRHHRHGAEVEVAVGVLRRAAHREVVEAHVGLVEDRRRDVAADEEPPAGLALEVEGHVVIAPHRVVAHRRKGARRELVGGHERVVALLDRLEVEGALVVARTRALVEVHEGVGIVALALAQPLDREVVDLELGAARAELGTPCRHLGGGAARVETRQQLGHHRHSILVALFDDIHARGEVQHAGIDLALDKNAAARRQHIVSGAGDEGHHLLLDRRILRGVLVVGHALRPYEEVGLEVTVEHLPREVVVAAAVDQHHAVVGGHGAERQRVGHRRAHHERKVALRELDGAVAVHVGGGAAERYHQAVEVAAARRRRRREEPRQRQVDLRRVDEGVGQGQRQRVLVAHRVALHLGIDREHGGAVGPLGVVEAVLVVDAARDPALDVARGHDRRHLLGAVARSVERRHDGTHRGARYVVDGDAVLLQRAEHAYVVESLRTAARKHQAHTGIGTEVAVVDLVGRPAVPDARPYPRQRIAARGGDTASAAMRAAVPSAASRPCAAATPAAAVAAPSIISAKKRMILIFFSNFAH